MDITPNYIYHIVFPPFYKTILLEVRLPCMWINLTLLTIYTFNGRTGNGLNWALKRRERKEKTAIVEGKEGYKTVPRRRGS